VSNRVCGAGLLFAGFLSGANSNPPPAYLFFDFTFYVYIYSGQTFPGLYGIAYPYSGNASRTFAGRRERIFPEEVVFL